MPMGLVGLRRERRTGTNDGKGGHFGARLMPDQQKAQEEHSSSSNASSVPGKQWGGKHNLRE